MARNPASNVGDTGSIPGSGRSPGEGNGNPLQYPCTGKSHGQRSLVGCSPWGRKELDLTKHTHTHIHDLIEQRLEEQSPWFYLAFHVSVNPSNVAGP